MFKKVRTLAVVLTTALTFSAITTTLNHVSADTVSDLVAVNKKIADTKKKVDAGQKKLDELTTKQYQMAREMANLQLAIKKRDKVLKNQARAAQLNDSNSTIDFLANSKSFGDFVDRSFTVATVVRTNNETLTDQKNDKKKVEDNKKQLEQAAKEQKATNMALQRTQAQLAVQQAALEVKKANEDAQAKAKAEEAQKKAEEAAKRAQEAKNQKDAEKAAIDAQQAVANVANKQNNQVKNDTKTQGAANAGGVIGSAQKYLGVPYVWGGTTPSGFDCSGLVQYVFAQNGISLPRTSQAQSTVGTRISVSEAQPGDLLFWGGQGSAYHVAISLGGGSFIHAPQPGENVKVGSVQYFMPSFAMRLK